MRDVVAHVAPGCRRSPACHVRVVRGGALERLPGREAASQLRGRIRPRRAAIQAGAKAVGEPRHRRPRRREQLGLDHSGEVARAGDLPRRGGPGRPVRARAVVERIRDSRRQLVFKPGHDSVADALDQRLLAEAGANRHQLALAHATARWPITWLTIRQPGHAPTYDFPSSTRSTRGGSGGGSLPCARACSASAA